MAETTGEERLFALEAFERIGDASALPALLAHARGFTPAERRRTGQLILHLGQSSVPILIELAQNSALRARPADRWRSARAWQTRSCPRCSASPRRSWSRSARRATYRGLASYAALTCGGDTTADEAGHAVLVRRCREYATGMLELILETLAVAGRLPNFETLVAALGSGASKDRGYAIETVEQACDRATFGLLLPLLDGRPIADQVAFAASQGLAEVLPAATVLVDIMGNAAYGPSPPRRRPRRSCSPRASRPTRSGSWSG